jgi:hypothetical protein
MRGLAELECVLVLLLLAFSGCVAPGSASAQVRVAGRLTTAEGNALGNEEVKVILPAAYGLSGLDAKMLSPATYGHYEQEVVVATDENGEFQHEFEPVTYSIVVFFLPPLGARPSHPPPPFVLVSVPSKMGTQAYLVGLTDGEAQYRVFDLSVMKSQTATLDAGTGPLAADFEKQEFRSEGRCGRLLKGWTVWLQLSPP